MRLMFRIISFILLSGISRYGIAQSVVEWVNEGISFENNKEHQKAVASFTKAIEHQPELAVAWYNRGVSRMSLKQYGLAVVDMNKAILLDTSNTNAYYVRYLAYFNTGNYQFALADLSHFLDKIPGDTQAHIDRYELLMLLQEYDDAKKELLWLSANSNSGTIYKEALAELFVKKGEWPAALKIYDELIAGAPSERGLYLSRAFIRNKASDFKGSQEDINMYLLYFPKDKEARKLKADNFFFLSEFKEALDLYENLFSGDTTNASIMADIGHCLLQLGRFSESEQVLTKAIRMKNDAPAYAYLGRGIARIKMNKGDEACLDWEKSLKLGEKQALRYLEQFCKKQSANQN